VYLKISLLKSLHKTPTNASTQSVIQLRDL